MNNFTDEKQRCGWCLSSDLYKEYHDQEWGTPVYDDATLFEFLLLETFQAGLSWITILNKRENFRAAFDQFDYKKIATYNDDKILELLQDAGIIRNKLSIFGCNKRTKFHQNPKRIWFLLQIYLGFHRWETTHQQTKNTNRRPCYYPTF